MTEHPNDIEQRHTPKQGNGLFTKIHFEPGSEVFRVTRPLASVLDAGHLRNACSNCFLWLPDNAGNAAANIQTADPKKLKACQNCKIVRYCAKVGSIEAFLSTSVSVLVTRRPLLAYSFHVCLQLVQSRPPCLYLRQDPLQRMPDNPV